MTPEITLDTRFDETAHAEDWKNQVAFDLNYILGRAVYHLETTNDGSDRNFAKAALAIVTRVAEFEGIQVK